MTSNIPKLNELSPYYHREDLLEEVVEQIKKDFNWFNLDITFKNDLSSPYLELFNQILPFIDDLLNNDYVKLMAVLYRIDINEDFLGKTLNENPSLDTQEVITDLILKRELQKVIIRHSYK